MKTKICIKCNQEKSFDQFNKGNDKFGLQYWCKECKKQYHLAHRAERKQQMKQYRLAHKPERKQYREDHRAELNQQMKQYYLDHKAEMKQYRLAHKPERKQQNKQYRLAHKPERNQYRKNKYHTDINYKISCYLRTRIWGALKNNSKSKSTMRLVGCSIDFFRCYYESKFTEGMSWEKVMNGEIHCDHRRPCASFDLSKPKEQHKCFHYTNLQPLWAKDNLEKSDKII